jgi:hypothetical protein
MCQYFALKLQPLIRPSETNEFLAFRTRQTILATAFVHLSCATSAGRSACLTQLRIVTSLGSNRLASSYGVWPARTSSTIFSRSSFG